MAAKLFQGSSERSDLRIVILGNEGDEKNKVVKSVLDCGNPTGVKVGLCALHQREQAKRRISVVEAPGWERTSRQTPENIKEMERSVTLCPPGPNVFLLVVPVKTLSEEPSANEITAAQTHVELLSERVWKHTILLFVCEDGVEEPQINEHRRGAGKILEKCGGRSQVLQKSTQSHELLEKMDNLVEKNHGDFYIPQAEPLQQKTQEASGASEIRHRRGSLNIPPDLNKDKGESGERKETQEPDKHTPLEDAPKFKMEVKQFVVILMGIFGALIGSVAGAQCGVSGSCAGLFFGIIVGVLLASITMFIYNNIYSRSYPKKPTQCKS